MAHFIIKRQALGMHCSSVQVTAAALPGDVSLMRLLRLFRETNFAPVLMGITLCAVITSIDIRLIGRNYRLSDVFLRPEDTRTDMKRTQGQTLNMGNSIAVFPLFTMVLVPSFHIICSSVQAYKNLLRPLLVHGIEFATDCMISTVKCETIMHSNNSRL